MLNTYVKTTSDRQRKTNYNLKAVLKNEILKQIMKHFVVEFVLLANLLLSTRSTSDVEFELDFVHSFLMKSDKLKKTDRLDNAEHRWIKKTEYKVKYLLWLML